MILNDGYPRYLVKQTLLYRDAVKYSYCSSLQGKKRWGESVPKRLSIKSMCCEVYYKALVLTVESFKDFYYNTNFFL